MTNLPATYTVPNSNFWVLRIAVFVFSCSIVSELKAEPAVFHLPDWAVQYDHDTSYTTVEVMPRFPGCEDMEAGNDAKKQCADMKMLEFIHTHIHYPPQARNDDIEGTVVVRFIVERDGKLSNLEIVRSVHELLDTESLRVVSLMNEMHQYWIPGYQRGETVRVTYNFPIRFRLQDKEE